MSERYLGEIRFGLLGCLFGFLGVALGAFGAHALSEHLSPDDLAIFQTAVRYQLFHALALVAVACIPLRRPSRTVSLSGWAFTVGVLFFSGSLYLLVLTGERWMGAVTPLGGVAFLIGWGSLGWAFLTMNRERKDHA